jgi:hypothetical protein
MSMTVEPCILEKWIWSHDDYDLMGWHDATVHAIALVPEQWELILDIDYIVRWVDPIPPNEYFHFWIAPATLVFQGVQDIKIEFNIPNIMDITLQGIERSNPRPTPNGTSTEWDWFIDSNEGRITFRADGYSQHFRAAPIRLKEQGLDFKQRCGLSFDRTAS